MQTSGNILELLVQNSCIFRRWRSGNCREPADKN